MFDQRERNTADFLIGFVLTLFNCSFSNRLDACRCLFVLSHYFSYITISSTMHVKITQNSLYKIEYAGWRWLVNSRIKISLVQSYLVWSLCPASFLCQRFCTRPLSPPPRVAQWPNRKPREQRWCSPETEPLQLHWSRYHSSDSSSLHAWSCAPLSKANVLQMWWWPENQSLLPMHLKYLRNIKNMHLCCLTYRPIDGLS